MGSKQVAEGLRAANIITATQAAIEHPSSLYEVKTVRNNLLLYMCA